MVVFAAFRKTIRWRPLEEANFHFHRKLTVRIAVRALKLEEFNYFYPLRRAPGGPAKSPERSAWGAAVRPEQVNFGFKVDFTGLVRRRTRTQEVLIHICTD